MTKENLNDPLIGPVTLFSLMSIAGKHSQLHRQDPVRYRS